ncbi:MAG: 7-cyano-7-deazaguanine synthase [Pirellulaceae bacterium]
MAIILPDGFRAGVLVSGGLDSCILLGQLLDAGLDVIPFYVRTGVVWESPEIQAVARFCGALSTERLAPLVELEMPVHDLYARHWSLTGRGTPDTDSPDEAVYLPGRNALLLIKASVWCQLHDVPQLALAPLGTSPFPDASAEFIRSFEHVVNLGAPRPVRIVLPFAHCSKREVMEMGRRYPLAATFSCIAPVDGMHCGACNKCAERQTAFRMAALTDPTRYAQD